MKVLHCITGLTPDGAQRMLARLARGLRDQGVSSTIVSLSKPEPFGKQLEAEGFPVHTLSVRAGFPMPQAILSLKGIIQREAPDVVQGWMYHANNAALVAHRLAKCGAPLFWNVRRGLDDYKERKALTKLMIRVGARLSRLPDRIIYCTPRSAAQHEAIGYDSKKTVVLGNGFDTSKFKPLDGASDALRQELSIPHDSHIIGNVGRFDAAKGHTYLLRAFADCSKGREDLRLVLVGRDVDDGNTELVNLASTLGIRDQVHFLGERSDVQALYPAFDIYCSSSIAEGFPNVVAEAMSSGVPCAVTDTGSSRELVGATGAVAIPRSVDQLCNAIASLVALSADERNELGNAARQRIRDNYSLERVVGHYRALYESASVGSAEFAEHPHAGNCDPLLQSAST